MMITDDYSTNPFVDVEGGEPRRDSSLAGLDALRGKTTKDRLSRLVVAMANEISAMEDAVARLGNASTDNFLLKQAYYADLAWLSRELKSIIASWHLDETFSEFISKGKIQDLSIALDKRVKEMEYGGAIGYQ